MMSLNEWFQANTRRPLAWAAVMVLTFWCSVAFLSVLNVENSQHGGFSQLLDVTGLAMTQKNRMLIESILHTARTQTRAISVALCQDSVTVLSSGTEYDACDNKKNVFHEGLFHRGAFHDIFHGNLFARTLRKPVPGFPDYSLSMTFSRAGVASEQIALLIAGLAFMAVTLLILRHVQRKFATEVFGPLQDGVLSDQPLRIAELESLRQSHQDAQSAKTSIAVADAVLSITKQVSHDIRSPLSALNMVVASLKELSEDKRLIIRNAAQRINDIANGLLKQGENAQNHNNMSGNSSNLIAELGASQSSSPTPATVEEPIMLVALLDSILSEKRVQYRERMEIEILGDLTQGYGLFAHVNASEFARVISNLVNNSVEAFAAPGPGQIHVTIRGHIREGGKNIAVIISDNGRGIPPEVLTRLGSEQGISHGKDEIPNSGSGLGVHHARTIVEAAGGEFTIESQQGVGTTITMLLPRAETPEWFVEKLKFNPDERVISVDDDQTIHQIWAGRLHSALPPGAKFEHLTFSSPDQFEAWHSSSVPADSTANPVYLIDYEFLGHHGQRNSGLDLIERLGLAKQAVLVTSRFDERHIRERASSLGVRILPKGLAPFVPIECGKARKKFDAIVIDDDPLVHMTWRMAASDQGKSVICFHSPGDFFAKAEGFSPASPVFIDVSLADGVRGEAVAEQVADLGFSDIVLATGHEATLLKPSARVKRVIGKEPVF